MAADTDILLLGEIREEMIDSRVAQEQAVYSSYSFPSPIQIVEADEVR